jgi:hypothetical protein
MSYRAERSVKDASVSSEDSFTGWLQLDAGDRCSISISGLSSGSGTVHFQRRFDGQTARDVKSYTDDAEESYEADERCEVRLGVKSGNYTSGTFDLRCGKG